MFIYIIYYQSPPEPAPPPSPPPKLKSESDELELLELLESDEESNILSIIELAAIDIPKSMILSTKSSSLHLLQDDGLLLKVLPHLLHLYAIFICFKVKELL